MQSFTYRRHRSAAIAFVLLLFASATSAQEFSLKSNENVDLNPVYWVSNCQSLLKSFVGVDVLEGPPGITLAIRDEEVLPRRQHCPNKVLGGTVVASVKGVPVKASGTLKYRVRYNTANGVQQSNHTVQMSLYP